MGFSITESTPIVDPPEIEHAVASTNSSGNKRSAIECRNSSQERIPYNEGYHEPSPDESAPEETKAEHVSDSYQQSYLRGHHN